MEAALWAFHTNHNFADGARCAVNLGDDADTTGAIYGQLAGAYYGESGIPPEWRERLAKWEINSGYADALACLPP
jgi:ADP-ribosyl-[dinitrogen reductase] hydrolase